MIKTELHIFFSALFFYTRIPIPKNTHVSRENLQGSGRYLSLIGWVIGFLGALSFFLASIILPISIAVLLSMITTVWFTGAFHEDGFADTCDGFGGGSSKDRIFLIMKDSRLGTFGVAGLFLILFLKYQALISLPIEQLAISIICGHSVSRLGASLLLYTGKYVSHSAQQKSENAAEKLSSKSLSVNIVFGLLPLFLYDELLVFITVLPVLAVIFLMLRFFTKHIGGYTGDCAGAAQQVSEVFFYLSLLVLWKFI